jgi:hypothetical protein
MAGGQTAIGEKRLQMGPAFFYFGREIKCLWHFIFFHAIRVYQPSGGNVSPGGDSFRASRPKNGMMVVWEQVWWGRGPGQ